MIRTAPLAVLALLLVAAPAEAAFQSCTHSGSVVTATFAIADGPSEVTFGTLRQVGNEIRADGVQCGGSATTANTDTIEVVGADLSREVLTIEIGGGTFLETGADDEPGGSDEIEFEVDLGSGSVFPSAEVRVTGTPGPDHVTFGTEPSPLRSRINLNADETDGVDADVMVDKAAVISVTGGPGNDVFNGEGGEDGERRRADHPRRRPNRPRRFFVAHVR